MSCFDEICDGCEYREMSYEPKADDLKANQKRINLVQDQLIHIIQILLTFAVLAIQ